MLELLLSGAFRKSATVTPSTYAPKPGDTVRVTVITKGITERVYWAILSNSEITTGFSPQQSSAIPTANYFTFNVVMPANEVNNNKTFRIGLSLVSSAEAANELTAFATSAPLTMGVLIPPVGQAVFTGNVTQYKVPPRVTSISGVIIGASGGGGNSTSSTPGGGGGGSTLVFFNNYPVTPGDTLSLTWTPTNVGFTQSGQDGATGGTIILKRNNVTLVQVNGSSGGSATGSGGRAFNVSALNATFSQYLTVRIGADGGSGSSGGEGGKCGNYRYASPVNDFESIDGSQSSGRIYGKGGSGLAGYGMPATEGRVRFIWGPNRSYPDNALDATVVN